jgi:hypothetical protein
MRLVNITGALALGLALLVSGCASLWGGEKVVNPYTTRVGTDDVVVMRLGSKKPVLSPWDREQWVAFRSSRKSALRRVESWLATGDPEAAMTLARAELSRKPKDRALLSLLATANMMTRRPQLARYYADQLEKHYPGSPEALNVSALATLLVPDVSVADMMKATEMFQRAMDRSSGEVASALNLAGLRLDMGFAPEAKEAYAEAASRCKQCREAVLGLGVAAGRAGDFDGSQRALDYLLRQNSRDPEALYYSAVLSKVGYNDVGKAARYLHQIVDNDDVGSESLRGRARVLLRVLNAGKSDDRG